MCNKIDKVPDYQQRAQPTFKNKIDPRVFYVSAQSGQGVQSAFEKLVTEAIALAAKREQEKGESIPNIAKRAGVTKKTMYDWLR